MELTDRKKRILRAIVETYIATAEPVGSKAVAELAGLDVSTATIRNEMADLTELGLLEQPHTSAGRIPSAAGYRLYVNELMDRQQLTIQETQRINEALNLKMEELDRVIDRAGKVLSQLSDYPVFTVAAAKERYDRQSNALRNARMQRMARAKKVLRANPGVSSRWYGSALEQLERARDERQKQEKGEKKSRTRHSRGHSLKA